MTRALHLAARGLEGVSPNPLVGAVVVRSGSIVGEGHHKTFGGPHAEVEALRSAGAAARGADLYVTLEPCAHHGKTPPCTDAIREAGLRRVFYAAADPNPATAGRGPAILRRSGIVAAGGLLVREARELIRPYLHWRATGRPWVIAKWGMSLDGKIATSRGESRWITGPRAREYAHRLRRRVDAVLVGTNTARADDPSLLPRPDRGRRPIRIVLDRTGRLPLALQFFAPGRGRGSRLYVVSSRVGSLRLARVAGRGVEVLVLPERRGRLDLARLLEVLGKRGISQLLVEGGGELLGAFLDRGLVQEVAAFVAPVIIGGDGAPGPAGGAGTATLAGALRLREPRIRRLGTDILIEGRVSGPR